MNKVFLMGRIVKDVELRYTQNNTAVAGYTIAVDKFMKDKDKETDFFNIVSWGNAAEFASKFFGKGLRISVVGRLQNRTYEDKDGITRYITEIVSEELHFADGKKENPNNQQQKNPPQQQSPTQPQRPTQPTNNNKPWMRK